MHTPGQAAWRWGLTLAVLVWVVCGTLASVPDWARAPGSARSFTQRELREDCDLALIFDGARQTPTLRDTLKWWHGVWVGQVPFWRPLTSLAFWSEIRLFGADRLDGWVWTTAALHVLATCLTALLAVRLSRSWWVGLTAAILFGVSLKTLPLVGPYEGLWSISESVIRAPQRQQEVLVTLPVLGALLAATGRRWVWALLLCGVAVCAKEMGWTAFALCPMAVWAVHGSDGVRAIPRWVWGVGLGLAALLVCARWCAGPEVFRGFHMGTNVAWPVRLLATCGGYWLRAVTQSAWSPALWSGLVFAAWLWCGRRGGGRWLAVAAVASLCPATVAQMLSFQVPWDVALTQLLTVEREVVSGLLSLVSLIVFYAYFSEREGRGLRLAVLAMHAITTAPYLAATQVQEAALYLQSAILATMTPLSAIALDQCLRRRYGKPTVAKSSVPPAVQDAPISPR